MNYTTVNGREINKDNMEPKESKSNKHFKLSMYKSGLRMIGCGAGMLGNLFVMASFFFVAEVLGVVEEL